MPAWYNRNSRVFARQRVEHTSNQYSKRNHKHVRYVGHEHVYPTLPPPPRHTAVDPLDRKSRTSKAHTYPHGAPPAHSHAPTFCLFHGAQTRSSTTRRRCCRCSRGARRWCWPRRTAAATTCPGAGRRWSWRRRSWKACSPTAASNRYVRAQGLGRRGGHGRLLTRETSVQWMPCCRRCRAAAMGVPLRNKLVLPSVGPFVGPFVRLFSCLFFSILQSAFPFRRAHLHLSTRVYGSCSLVRGGFSRRIERFRFSFFGSLFFCPHGRYQGGLTKRIFASRVEGT